MRNAIVACAAVILSSANPIASQVVRMDRLQERGAVLRRPTVPSAFRGHWSMSLQDCGADAVDDSQVWITPTSLNYYETNGHIIRVVAEDGSHAVVTIRADNEGRTFVAKKGLALSPDGRTLTIRNEDDAGSTSFRRCPPVNAVPTFTPHHMIPTR